MDERQLFAIIGWTIGEVEGKRGFAIRAQVENHVLVGYVVSKNILVYAETDTRLSGAFTYERLAPTPLTILQILDGRMHMNNAILDAK